MIRAAQLKVQIEHTEEDIKKALLKALKIKEEQLISYEIAKRSIDARKKDEVRYIYTIDATVKEEKKIMKRHKGPNISLIKPLVYRTICDGDIPLTHRPVVVGSGPAGLFCALKLAEFGFQPLLLERGEQIEERVKTVEKFWAGNPLNPMSNVQFGEGGAGTFSDGKLNTLVKDETGRNRKVLQEFVNHGAPPEILYLNKPHIGTDKLRAVVSNLRQRIIELGGEVRFKSQLTDVLTENGQIKEIEVNHNEKIPCQVLVMAIGHSARDTFELMHGKGFLMQAKSFAVGVRMEHSQRLINESQYGACASLLPAAEYKLTHKALNGRGVYSFCMCPGGFVVNSSSEEGRLVVNGMSNYARDEANANSAIIVTVNPEDFSSNSPLAGVQFQRELEEAACAAGDGRIPVQLFGDFMENKPTKAFGSVKPSMKGAYGSGDLRACLPDYITESLIEGIQAFDKKIRGFANPEAVLSGVESRTSSPLRIIRDEGLESSIKGVYPCGEGAGYAGGITSAAMDGLKVAEMIAHHYYPQ